MYNNKQILAFIPARKGSKRVPGKNLKHINDTPLFMYSVNAAKKSKYIDSILVSSDSQEIKDLSVLNGCVNGNLRPKELSDDKSRIIDAILYEVELNKIDADVIVLLQPTFPFRTSEIIDGAIEEYFKTGEESVITVVESEENPVFLRSINGNGCLEKIINRSSDIRSQDFDKFYRIVGNVYVNNYKLLTPETVLNENKYPYFIDKYYCLDIDTFNDFNNAKIRLEGNNYDNNVSLCKKEF